jgi:hypothetical protein
MAVIALFAAAPAARAATYETQNFVVDAPTAELAKRFGERAEHYRREKAEQWLGREMPPWPRKCPLRVETTMGPGGGATHFTFGADSGNRPAVTSQRMEIRGDATQLLNSVLPHEVTHTVLAQHFGRPVPRWADEGGSVLSENDAERYSHDIRCREILNNGKAFRLNALFRMTDYPKEMSILYAQGYSVTAFLVEKGGGDRGGRGKLLQFLGAGMRGNSSESWNEAARSVYGFDSVDGLEKAWLEALRTPPSRTVAREGAGGTKPAATPTAAGTRTELRSSAAPGVPVLDPPVRAARAAAPDAEPVARPTHLPAARPAVAPDYPPPVLGPPEFPRARP